MICSGYKKEDRVMYIEVFHCPAEDGDYYRNEKFLGSVSRFNILKILNYQYIELYVHHLCIKIDNF